jgi:nitrogen fixation protein NifU and related proteins
MNGEDDRNWIGGDSEEDEIYKENILDHFRNPRNFGKVENPTIQNHVYNPVCGDKIEVSAVVDNGVIKDIKFFGKGCAISIASASMLTEKIKNMTMDELKNLKEEEILEMIGVPLGVVRMKCGLLGLKTLKEGIEKAEVIKHEQIRN